jgi:hypothetical protein
MQYTFITRNFLSKQISWIVKFRSQLELARRPLGITQSLGTTVVEAQHPMADRLKANSAKARRTAARPAIINLRQGQKPARLISIARPLRQTAKSRRIEVVPKPNC